MSCALCPTPFAQQHLKLVGPPNSGRSVAEWPGSLREHDELYSELADLNDWDGPDGLLSVRFGLCYGTKTTEA